MKPPTYLGDGAYVKRSQFGELVLYTTDGVRTTNSVYLEDSAIAVLLEFLKEEEKS